MKERLPAVALIGAGGHARVVADVIARQGRYRVACMTDDGRGTPGMVRGIPMVGAREALLAMPEADRPRLAIVGIGTNDARLSNGQWLLDHGFELITAIDPSAVIGGDVVIGRGTVIMPGAVLNAGTTVGDHSIINTRASVDHDGRIGDGVHIAPGATLCGGVTVGDGAFVCAGSTVIPYRTIGARATVGAGATVLHDVDAGVTVVGVPARPLTHERT